MGNLEDFMNNDHLTDLDPLTRMAIIHHQFETIHPFYDGNGRTGRILNILYLVRLDLLGTPVLYLSRFINQNKAEYYRLLQAVRTDGAWEEWVMFMLEGIEQTARQTTRLVHRIRDLMLLHKVKIRTELPRIYSQDLLNNIFGHPYSKIAFVERDLGVSRITATRYLDELTKIGVMQKLRIGRDNYYVNHELVDLLCQVQAV
jgi:Fic family protein